MTGEQQRSWLFAKISVFLIENKIFKEDYTMIKKVIGVVVLFCIGIAEGLFNSWIGGKIGDWAF